MKRRLQLMNWTCLVYGGPMFLVMAWWFISARKWFKGPKVNLDHLMLGREGNVLEGEDKVGNDGDSSSDGQLDKSAEAGAVHTV
jgi:hypothetical protein